MSLLSRLRSAAGAAVIQAVGKERVARALGVPLPENVERVRKMFGGQLAPPPVSILEWFQDDIHTAKRAADTGDLKLAGQLCHALRGDGMVLGLLKARTGYLVRLPKRFTGNVEMRAALEGPDHRRGVFEAMFPAKELAALVADGILLGVGVAELLPVEGRSFPVLRRLDPQYLRYRWNEGAYYYDSIAGPLPITPGDGRWILHSPGGEVAPWNGGTWFALARAFVSKDHAFMYEEAYAAKHAHPARVARTAAGATNQERLGFLEQLIAWGINTVIEMPPTWELDLIESNGVGYEVYKQLTERRNEEIALILAGSKVLVDGGSAFSNDKVYESIRADLVQEDADGLGHTLNTQGIPPWVNETYGADALEEAPLVEYDVTPPTDLKSESEAQKASAEAISAWNGLTGQRVDIDKMAVRYRVPIRGDVDGDGAADDGAPGVEIAEPDEGDDALPVAAADDAEDIPEAA
jgi:hypothetical protein